jgi:hypothetical protein
MFYAALCVGFRVFIRIALANPFLTPTEKRQEVMRLTRILFRFDNGSYTPRDMIEARDVLHAVPEGHYAYVVARRLRS